MAEAARRTGIPKTTLFRWNAAEHGRDVSPKRPIKLAERRAEKEKGDAPRAPRQGPPPKVARAREPSRLAQLGPEGRSNLHKAARGLLRMLAPVDADDPALVDDIDMRRIAEAARALKTVFEIAPGITAFDQETGDRPGVAAEVSPEQARAELERMAVAAGLRVAGAATSTDPVDDYEPETAGGTR